jgi:hypothetical protein
MSNNKRLTTSEAQELGAFLLRHNLRQAYDAQLHWMPLVQEMLYNDLRRFQERRPMRYIVLSRESMSQNDSPRVSEMKRLRLAGLTLEEIGNQFGVSREWVRQLIDSMPPPFRPTQKFRQRLTKTLKRWLWDAGYRRCYCCKLWKADMQRKTCRECERQRANRRYHTQGGKEKARAWQRAHPEQCAAATRRFLERKRGKARL